MQDFLQTRTLLIAALNAILDVFNVLDSLCCGIANSIAAAVGIAVVINVDDCCVVGGLSMQSQHGCCVLLLFIKLGVAAHRKRKRKRK